MAGSFRPRMSVLGAALVVTSLLGAPSPATASTTLAERVAAERARNAGFPPLVARGPTLFAPRAPPEPGADCESCRANKRYPDYVRLHLGLIDCLDERQQCYLARAAELDADIVEAERDGRRARAEHLRLRRNKLEGRAGAISEQKLGRLEHLIGSSDRAVQPFVAELLHRRALELVARDRDDALVAVLTRLQTEYPDGPHRPYALAAAAYRWLARGDLTRAREAFTALLAGPRRELDASAHVGLGWSHMRAAAGEGPRPDLALAAFTRAIEVAADDGPTLDSARDGLVHAFAAAGRPVRAAALFTRLAALPRPVERRDVALLERLALAYFARGQPRESAVIDRELLRRHPADPEACTWQTRLLLTAVATRDLAAQHREAQRLAALWQRWQSDPRHPDEIQRKCRDAARDALIDLTRAWRPTDPARVAPLCAAHRRLFPDDPPVCAAGP